MITGKIGCGFEYKIDREVLESWEVLEAINEVEDNPVRIVKLVNVLLGEKQKKSLIKYLGGHPSAKEMSDAITEIFHNAKENAEAKN